MLARDDLEMTWKRHEATVRSGWYNSRDCTFEAALPALLPLRPHHDERSVPS